MPELPEVEVSCQGIRPHLVGQTIKSIDARVPKLRWPIPDEFKRLGQCQILSVSRRAKYILLETTQGVVIIHLGMSGALRVVEQNVPAKKHDHIDLVLTNGKVVRYQDPRRFGSWLWSLDGTHPLLDNLGPEPLSDDFTPSDMLAKAHGKKVSIKTFLMNGQYLVGVGNIYANEALFKAKLLPMTHASSLNLIQWTCLVDAIKMVLTQAIEQGGTTLKDFVKTDGKPGYFAQKLYVYGRDGKPCHICGAEITKIIQAQRASFYCSVCQI